MVTNPIFTHIHCSSRFDRSAADLEIDVDNWRQRASIITLTEVGNDQHARTLQEKGWGYYNASGGRGRDESAICWDKSVWRPVSRTVRRTNNKPLQGPRAIVWSCTVLLKHAITSHKLLVSSLHAPAHVDNFDRPPPDDTQAYWMWRKSVYLEVMNNWSVEVKNMVNRARPDGVLLAADWNLNLKEDWVRAYLKEKFKDFRIAWTRFPTEGGSMSGGPVAPLGAPGKATGDRIIDGSLTRGLSVDTEPNLLARVRSSDHRPYLEGFVFNNRAGNGLLDGKEQPATGDTKKGNEWWGFGDYLDDDIYSLTRVTEGGET